jgi:hypothetical protein
MKEAFKVAGKVHLSLTLAMASHNHAPTSPDARCVENGSENLELTVQAKIDRQRQMGRDLGDVSDTDVQWVRLAARSALAAAD